MNINDGVGIPGGSRSGAVESAGEEKEQAGNRGHTFQRCCEDGRIGVDCRQCRTRMPVQNPLQRGEAPVTAAIADGEFRHGVGGVEGSARNCSRDQP